MPYDPNKHHRRSTRLKGYDYTQEGAYFITICTFAKQYLFGEIENDQMSLSDYGQIATDCWVKIPTHFPHIELDEFVVMPNHMHGIIVITNSVTNVGAEHVPPSSQHTQSSTNESQIPQSKAGSLSVAIRSYKAAVTRQINNLYHAPAEQFWQRNYHDHIIRDEIALNYLRAYVVNNPASWIKDSLHVSRS